MEKRGGLLLSNWAHILWFLFYFLITWALFGGTGGAFLLTILVYTVSIGFALSPIGEKFYRLTSGIRPLALKEEIELIQPIFDEVYEDAKNQDEHISENIQLYIEDTMEVNACAIGRTTVAVTKGAMQFMNTEELKGLFAHELGHMAHGDTKALLLTCIGNGVFNIFLIIGRWVLQVTQRLSYAFNNGPIFLISWLIGKIIELFIFVFLLVGDILLMHSSRRSEYLADGYASSLGYGNQLKEALIKLQNVSTTGKRSVMDLLKATHPTLISRIIRLEKTEHIESTDGVIT